MKSQYGMSQSGSGSARSITVPMNISYHTLTFSEEKSTGDIKFTIYSSDSYLDAGRTVTANFSNTSIDLAVV